MGYCIVQASLQLLGYKSNLRLQQKVLVIARDFVYLQAANRTFFPRCARIAQLTERLVIRLEQNNPARINLRPVTVFRLYACLSDFLDDLWQSGNVPPYFEHANGRSENPPNGCPSLSRWNAKWSKQRRLGRDRGRRALRKVRVKQNHHGIFVPFGR